MSLLIASMRYSSKLLILIKIAGLNAAQRTCSTSREVYSSNATMVGCSMIKCYESYLVCVQGILNSCCIPFTLIFNNEVFKGQFLYMTKRELGVPQDTLVK